MFLVVLNKANTAAPIVALDNRVSKWFPRRDVFDSSSNRINDVMAYWRSVSRSMNIICPSIYDSIRADGRMKFPIDFHFDTYVHSGEAVAIYGAHFIQMPFGWANSGLHDFSSLMTGHWGLGHEYGHHHQNGWGFGEKGEVTTNVHNIISYSLYSLISGTRRPQLDSTLKITTRDSWEYTTHGYTLITSDRSSENYDFLNFYGNPAYSFGPKAFRKFLHQNYLDDAGKRSGMIYLKDLTEMFHLNFEEYFNSYSYTMQTPEKNPDVYPEAELEALRANNYPSYHPVANAYENGFLNEEGEFIETGRPFEISPKQGYTFDFNRFTKTRKRMNYTYSIKDVRQGNGTLTKITDGVYYYTPVEDVHALDQFYVTYEDDTNGQLRTSVITVKQGSDRPYYSIYTDAISDDVVASYEHVVNTKQLPIFTELSDNFGTRNHKRSDLNKTLCISSGTFYPSYSDTYTFSLKHRGQVLFYLSTEPLSGNPTSDSQHLVIHNTNDHTTLPTSESESGENIYSVELTAHTKYYYKVVIVKPNKDFDSYVDINFKTSQQPEYAIGPVNLLYCPDCTPDMEDPHPFINPLEDFEFPQRYNYDRYVYLDNRKYKLKTKTSGLDIWDMPTQMFNGKTTGDPTSYTFQGIWPQEFEITFDKNETFNGLYLSTMTTYGKYMNSDVTFSCIVNGTKEIIYKGVYKSASPVFRFHKYYTTDKFTIVVHNNNESKWGSVPACVSFNEFTLARFIESSGEYVVPITHTNHTIEGSSTWTRAGLYYNNKGLLLHEGSRYTININETEGLGVIGDIGQGLGTFDFYVDGEFYETVDTTQYSNLMRVSLNSQNAKRSYQKPLCFANHLEKGNHSVTIEVTKGTVGLAGFVSDTPPTEYSKGESNDPPTLRSTPKYMPKRKLFKYNYLYKDV